ncbi:deoxyribodipyrimidine photolyase [Bradyrhizobium sp. i1.15.2]
MSSAGTCCTILATENLQANFDGFPWKPDAKALAAWQRGRTGYPIVDAGLRELWHTGVMHNQVRGGHLVKHLLIDVPTKLIHQPWQAMPIELASAGVTLGKSYPQPIVDHAKGRERALAAYAKIRKG